MSNIPYARAIIQEVYEQTKDGRLDIALRHMTRVPKVRRAPTSSRVVDEALARQIRDYAACYPDMSFQEIANHFGTNPGRVSEAMHHLR